MEHHDQVPRLLTAYDEIRQPRCAAASEYEYHHQLMLKAPIGPLQELRDMALQKTLVTVEGQRIDEDLFRDAWGTELILFAHDATEKANDWWRQWGYMIAKGRKTSTGIQVSISKGNTVSRPDCPSNRCDSGIVR